MSAAGLARFALSDEGQLYARMCRRYGLDPARHLEDFDEVLAHDFRTALAMTVPLPPVPDLEAQIAGMFG